MNINDHISPQGNEYEKNILAFANYPTELSWTDKAHAMREVKLAIAVAFGKGKHTDKEKREWFDKHEGTEAMDWRKAKEPTYARAQLLSLEMLRTKGYTNIPVELDATCSAKQMVAVLTGDLKTATCCNIISDNSHVQDAYGMVAKEMSRITGLRFNRNQIKQSDMIDGYGAGEKLVTQQLKDDLKEHYFDGAYAAFVKATNNVCPTVSVLKSTFQALWDDSRTEYNWTLPDGFRVTYRTQEARQIIVNPFGTGEIPVICHMIMPTSRNTGLGVNIIHSVDGYVCRQIPLRCNFDVITIHDGFRCLPQYAQRMRNTFVEIMAEITDSTLLEDIIHEISGIEFKLNKQFSGHHVLNSVYAIS